MILPELSYRVPLKPISGSTLSSGAGPRRRRLSWGNYRTGATRGGSEDSASSSSSIDLETEDDDGKTLSKAASGEDQFKHAGTHYRAEADTGSWCFDVQSTTSHVPPIHRCTLGQDADFISQNKANDADNAKELNRSQLLTKCIYFNEDEAPITERPVKATAKSEMIQCQTTELETEIRRATYNLTHDQVLPITSSKGISRSDEQHVKVEESGLEDCCAHKSMPSGRKIALQTAQGRNLPQVTAVKLPQYEISPTREEQTLRVQQPVRRKERRSSATCRQKANIPTDPKALNILANKNPSMPNRNLPKNTRASAQVEDKSRENPEVIINRDKSCTKGSEKLKVVKGSQYGDGNMHSKRINPATPGSARDQKRQAVKELQGSHLCKGPGLAGKPRPQSALDFITYKDMFQQIQSSDKGPVIYEMFAGPIYDNLRGSCHKVKVRQVQSAHTVTKTPVKSAQRTEAVAKAKPKPASTRLRVHHRAGSKIDKHKKASRTRAHGSLEAESPHSDNADEERLSTIEESFARHGTGLKSCEKTHTEAATPVRSVYPDGGHHIQVQDANANSSVEKQNRLPAPTHSQESQQLKINTWTLSSSSKINPVSPQNFLDGNGDGPFTDDLLQCLAEKLISLDERGTSHVEPYREEASSATQFSEVKFCCIHLELSFFALLRVIFVVWKRCLRLFS